MPYCWLVALSFHTLKYVLLPSAAAVPPTLPRPFLSVLEVEMSLCVALCEQNHV